MAVFQRDTLVAHARLLGDIDGIVAPRGAVGAKAEALAVDRAGSGDADVCNAFTPDERIVPVVVTVILVVLPRRVRLGRVIRPTVVACRGAGQRGLRGDDGRTLRKIKPNVTLQVNREAQPCSRGENYRAPTGGRGCVNGFVDGGRVNGLAIADGAIRADIEDPGPAAGDGA